MESEVKLNEKELEKLSLSDEELNYKNPNKKSKKKIRNQIDMYAAFMQENLDEEDEVDEVDDGGERDEIDDEIERDVMDMNQMKTNEEFKKTELSKSQKSKKKKKKVDDEWDELLGPKKNKTKTNKKKNDDDDWAELLASKPKKVDKISVSENPVNLDDDTKIQVSNETNIAKKKRNKKNKNKEEGNEQTKETDIGVKDDLNKKTKGKEAQAKPIKKKNQALLAKMKEKLELQRLEEERKKKEEEAIKRALEEAEARDRENERLLAEAREKKKQEKKERLLKLKEDGKPITKVQRENHARLEMLMNSLKGQGIEIPQKGKLNHNENLTDKKPIVYQKKKKIQKKDENIRKNEELDIDEKKCFDGTNRSYRNSENVPDDWETVADIENNDVKLVEKCENGEIEKDENVEKKKKMLRAPVICVLGHVDTGKTKILDKLRLTNVQGGEAGGITQQIGVTNVGKQNIINNLEKLDYMKSFRYLVPGFLIIDTPGHESFRNLRSRGSSLCDIAVLVVDIMHGLEQQTIESLELLLKKKSPFVIALNKVDRLFGWKSNSNISITNTLKEQAQNTINEFNDRFNIVKTQFAEKSVNVALFNEMNDYKNQIAIVPTSAHTGDGISDLIAYLCTYSQSHLLKRLLKDDTNFQAIVLEVKSVLGYGMVIDIILINGTLNVGDNIVLSGFNGPIVTQIKAILTPQPMTDLRALKNNYVIHQKVNVSQGIRISAAGDLDKVIAGTPMLVVSSKKTLDECIEESISNIESVLNMIQTDEIGVHVQASTLGSLEALLEFLKTSKIPVSGVSIGPVHKKDVLKASVMHQKDPNYAVILAFDVKVETEAQIYAKKEDVKIFTADIIYHLFDEFTKYTQDCKNALKEKYKNMAVFPCKLRILPQYIFNARDPIVLGVMVEAGNLRLGTPISIPSKDFMNIGTVTSIESNHKTVENAFKGQEVSIKIELFTGEAPKAYDRHFNYKDMLVSKISRESIDILKDYFRDEMLKSDWQLIVELKKTFSIL